MANKFFLFLILLALQYAHAQEFGHFIGDVDATWDEDGRSMTLTQPFSFVDSAGRQWDAENGDAIDGSSIPAFAWSFVGSPFVGKHRFASVVHDVACRNRKRRWDKTHYAFYEALRAADVGFVKAQTMYAAVYFFGPRWQSKILQCFSYTSSGSITKIPCNELPLGAPDPIQVPKKYVDNGVTYEYFETIFGTGYNHKWTRDDFLLLKEDIESQAALGQPLSIESINNYAPWMPDGQRIIK